MHGVNGYMIKASNKCVHEYDPPPDPPSLLPTPCLPLTGHTPTYMINCCVPQPIDWVPLKNGLCSFRAQMDQHHPVDPGTSHF